MYFWLPHISQPDATTIAAAVLTSESLQFFDVASDSVDQLEVIRGAALQHSALTCTRYFDTPGTRLIVHLKTAGRQARQHVQSTARAANFSPKPSPISGGINVSDPTESTGALVITGHADGMILFWHLAESSWMWLKWFDVS